MSKHRQYEPTTPSYRQRYTGNVHTQHQLRLTCRAAITMAQNTCAGMPHQQQTSAVTQYSARLLCKYMKKRLYYNKIYQIIYPRFKKKQEICKM